jgi:hypothetical protein
MSVELPPCSLSIYRMFPMITSFKSIMLYLLTWPQSSKWYWTRVPCQKKKIYRYIYIREFSLYKNPIPKATSNTSDPCGCIILWHTWLISQRFKSIPYHSNALDGVSSELRLRRLSVVKRYHKYLRNCKTQEKE